MAEKVLVPLDGSKQGEAALGYLSRFVGSLCPESKVSVILLQVVRMHNPYNEMGGIDGAALPEGLYDVNWAENQKQKAQEYLDRSAKQLEGKNIDVTTRIVMGGNPAEEIIKAEKELSCDLVVMATHGRSGLSRWAFGSVTDKVLRAGSVPVLMVRAQ